MPLVGSYLDTLLDVPSGSEHGRRAAGGIDAHVGVRSIAFDPGEGVLYGYRFWTAELLRIDPDTGSVAVIGPSGASAYLDLALDPESKTLYAVDELQDVLFVLDLASGRAREIAPLAVGAIETLAFDSGADRLLGWSALTGELITIDPATGATVSIGPLGLALAAMAFDPASQRLLACTPAGQLVQVDPGTAGVQSGPDLGFPVAGLAIDPARGTVYGSTAYELVNIDRESGDTGDVITYGYSDVATIEFDAGSSRLLAVVHHFDGKHAGESQLIAIDADAGTATRLALMNRRIQDLAIDPRSGALLGVDDSSELVTIDPGTGRVVPLGIPPTGAHEITHHSSEGVLYGYVGFQLVRIDSTDGHTEPVGTPVAGPLESLAFEPVSQRLIAYDVLEQELVAIDPATGVVELLFAAPFPVTGLAFAPKGVGYATGFDLFAGRTFEFDLVGARFSALGELGDYMLGLARDPVSGKLYGVGAGYSNVRCLYEIDGTGRATLIATLGARDVRGLAFDPRQHVLYGSDVAADELVTIDPATGSTTVVGPMSFSDVEGLAFDPASANLYGSDVASGQIVSIDTTTGACSAVLTLGFDGAYGLAADGAGSLATVASSTAAGGPLLSIDPVSRVVKVVAEVPRGVAGLGERSGR